LYTRVQYIPVYIYGICNLWHYGNRNVQFVQILYMEVLFMGNESMMALSEKLDTQFGELV